MSHMLLSHDIVLLSQSLIPKMEKVNDALKSLLTYVRVSMQVHLHIWNLHIYIIQVHVSLHTYYIAADLLIPCTLFTSHGVVSLSKPSFTFQAGYRMEVDHIFANHTVASPETTPKDLYNSAYSFRL